MVHLAIAGSKNFSERSTAMWRPAQKEVVEERAWKGWIGHMLSLHPPARSRRHCLELMRLRQGWSLVLLGNFWIHLSINSREMIVKGSVQACANYTSLASPLCMSHMAQRSSHNHQWNIKPGRTEGWRHSYLSDLRWSQRQRRVP